MGPPHPVAPFASYVLPYLLYAVKGYFCGCGRYVRTIPSQDTAGSVPPPVRVSMRRRARRDPGGFAGGLTHPNSIRGGHAHIQRCYHACSEAHRHADTLVNGQGVPERRQSFWPDDNYFGRSIGTIIWYPGGARLDHGSAGSSTEAEAYGRQDTAGSGSSIGNE